MCYEVFIAQKAANWWGDKLRRVDYNNFRMREGKQCVVSDVLFATYIANSYKNKEDDISKFISILADRIINTFESKEALTLEVKGIYPDSVISSAAKEAGINTYALPWDTCMYIERSAVRVVSPGGTEVIFNEGK